MTFKPSKTELFRRNFDSNKDAIRNFEGCQFLELYKDKHNSNVFFTYSYWDSEHALETYRQSNLFKSVWSKTKPLFDDKPVAWSVEKVDSLS